MGVGLRSLERALSELGSRDRIRRRVYGLDKVSVREAHGMGCATLAEC